MSTLSPELRSLAQVAAFTGLLWVPLIANRLRELGVWPALRNPEPDARPHAAWAWRLDNAHRNALENLAVFAPLALAVQLQGLGDATTAMASQAFVLARVTHAVVYTAGVPVVRTVAFLAGFGAQIVLAWRLLG